MNDLYCYEGTDVLKNKLDIRDSKTLDLIEAEQSRMAMMLMYNENLSDFTSNGFIKYITNCSRTYMIGQVSRVL